MSDTMLHFVSHGLAIAELWFDETLPGGRTPDIVRYRQALSPPCPDCTDFYTLVIDLAQGQESLLAGLKKETRYEVRRAQEKDALTLDVWDGRCQKFRDDFVSYYNGFAATKRLPRLDKRNLELLSNAGRLDLSRSLSSTGEVLVCHAYYRHCGRVRLLHSASHFRGNGDGAFRALVGRANRWLHWQDLMRFKAAGYSWYDWGGWYEGHDDASRLGINQFKESFGGEVLRTYNGEVLLSVKAHMFACVAKLLGRR